MGLSYILSGSVGEITTWITGGLDGRFLHSDARSQTKLVKKSTNRYGKNAPYK